ncbi:unnamed protein product [Prunus armeniaca]
MEDLRRYLERQERETNERSRRRAERQRLQREEDEQVVIAVALLDEENQGRRRRGSQVGRGLNVDIHRHSRVFNNVLRGQGPNITYQVNNTVYQTGYHLADDIYPRWTTFVKSNLNPRSQKQKLFASYQEGYRKDVERCFGILQARWLIIRGAAHMFDEEILRSIMMTCIILLNMIVEDEYDFDVAEVYKPDPMNTALTRIHERPMGQMENHLS